LRPLFKNDQAAALFLLVVRVGEMLIQPLLFGQEALESDTPQIRKDVGEQLACVVVIPTALVGLEHG
jgi:hypothetical protein